MDNRPLESRRRSAIENIYPLSPMQEGLLFHSIATPDEGVYVPQIVLQLRGAVDPQIMHDCWSEMVSRHAVLRTTFHWEERDEPFQVVHSDAGLVWSQLDWSGIDAEEQQRRLGALLSTNRRQAFDLKKAPLIRLQWIDYGGEHSRLVLQYHHIILDGWSAGRIVEDAFRIYQRRCGSSRPPLPAPRPYVDYIAWLKSRKREATRAFWTDYTAKIEGPCRMTRDATGGEADFSSHHLTCDPAVSTQATKLCREMGITPNTLLQAALAIVIARKTGSRHVVFGATTAGRPSELQGVENMVGLFINTLPVCIDVENGPLAPWLQTLQQRQSACAEHDYLPLREIQAGRGDLFDCLLVFENYPVPRDISVDATFAVTGVEVDEWTHYPLTLFAVADATKISVSARYDRHRIAEREMEAFLHELGATIGEMAGGTPTVPNVSAADIKPVDIARPALPSVAETHDDQPLPTTAWTETEERIARIWAEVLKVEAQHNTDNFFDLGGHSLLAARVVNRVRREFAINFPVKVLFDRPVLAAFAGFIDALKATAAPVGEHNAIEI
ncbi:MULTISPECIES: condensation domain-containing protein [Agrobacterium]|uniref:Siderophore biosynthesis protein n=1 Tax=Agrobacterium tumefaciens TaxID=358 RepID=A0AAE6BFP1_AGRTU|nr:MULTISPECIES: condensation domain-containing protein [Agrobacterium]QCL75571.1 siderophore biosynthesis protein [Agrobacterium tumefaciens]QCL81133.1 siderophore biosynthesis protein [Agrobacterium tumefaciens]CUX57973.1 Putative non-ribosomal peptide synthetase (NRPS) (Domain structure: C, PCP); putative siderophore biosynthesis protein [Agrobacterium sp. NCPPB 925]